MCLFNSIISCRRNASSIFFVITNSTIFLSKSFANIPRFIFRSIIDQNNFIVIAINV